MTHLAVVTTKLPWCGTVISVQPRICLLRSLDRRSHNHFGFVLRLDGDVGGEHREFSVRIGKAVQAKHEFAVGFNLSGEGVPVQTTRLPPSRQTQDPNCAAENEQRDERADDEVGDR